jgi:hypothetical protein
MLRKKQVRAGRPPKPWLADLHVRIDRQLKRGIELRALEEHKELGALVEEAIKLLENERIGYPKALDILRAIQGQMALLGPDLEAEKERRQRLEAKDKRFQRRRNRRSK